MQPVQLKMARAALGLSIDQLASKVGLSHLDIARLEDGTDGDDEHTGLVRSALETDGIEWIEHNGVRFVGQAANEGIAVEDLTTGNDGGIS